MSTCPHCAANLALVGRVHRCMANTDMANSHVANGTSRRKGQPTLESGRTVKVGEPDTYRYRDAEKRRAYMRGYMKKRRGAPST
jgi:hypothetical protein